MNKRLAILLEILLSILMLVCYGIFRNPFYLFACGVITGIGIAIAIKD